ncbi:MAG: hypothetical protein F7O42_11395 [Opitutae bacterium]|nr:hypothetical protein [Opitutae bacterium]
MWLKLGAKSKSNQRVISAIGPGQVASAKVLEHKVVKLGETIKYRAPDVRVLAFDGEREYLLSKREEIEITLEIDGPAILNVPAILKKAALRGDLQTKN